MSMLQLETRLNTKGQSVCKATNLTDRFTEKDLTALGEWAWDGYMRDERSRTTWMNRTQAAMDLAVQLQTPKNFPWAGCANVAFPLVTIAAMEFHSRAYPVLISGTDVVKCRVPGPDPTGQLKDRAERVSQYMSYQVLEEDESWVEQHDRLLLQLPILGCAFKKTRRHSSEDRNVSELVSAHKLVLDYYAKSVEGCYRKTHLVEFYRNEIYGKCKSEVWRDFLDEPWYKEPQQPYTPDTSPQADKRKGETPPQADEATPLTFLEMHVWIDLDQDGYAEPYILTVDAVHKQVARLVARWDDEVDVERTKSGDVLRIKATEHFTKYELIPSPDGSIYGMGFGILLGPLNEAVNSIVNQLIDAGTLAVTAGGFIARGVKVRSGQVTLPPFGWQRADCTGEDLAKGFFAVPVREPSNVLFTLLSFLVNYTQRISGSTDMLAGENPGQNTPAQTSQEMVVQGMKIYSALFKRVWRCMKNEFEKLYILDAKYLPATKHFGDGGKISREDFLGDPSQIRPAADPNVVSDSMRIQLALEVANRATGVPGYDIPACERNLHKAMKLEGSEVLYPGPDKVPPLPNPKVQVEQMKMQVKQMELEFEKNKFIAEMQEEMKVNQAHILEMLAHAASLEAQAQDDSTGKTIEMINMMIAAVKMKNEHLHAIVDKHLKAMEIENERMALQQQAAKASASKSG